MPGWASAIASISIFRIVPCLTIGSLKVANESAYVNPSRIRAGRPVDGFQPLSRIALFGLDHPGPGQPAALDSVLLGPGPVRDARTPPGHPHPATAGQSAGA